MNTSKLSIRAYDAADCETLSAIWLKASLIAHDFIGEATLNEQRVLIEEQYLPAAETWVACLDNKPVGFISLLDDFIGGLFVDPNCQGYGIGKTLVAHAFALKKSLKLEVYTANTRAYDFYRKLGFIEVSRRPVDDQGLPFENAQLFLS